MPRGYQVAFPYGEDWDFDLIVCGEGKLERIQVKYATSNGAVLVVPAASNSLTNGKVRVVKRYASEMIDWLAAYDDATDRCYYIPADEPASGMRMIGLGITPARNGQQRRIRDAGNYTRIRLPHSAYHLREGP